MCEILGPPCRYTVDHQGVSSARVYFVVLFPISE